MMLRLKTLLGVVIVVGGAYSAYWYYIAYYAEDYIKAKVRNLAQYGVELDYRAVEVSGFPYRVVATFDRARFSFRQGNSKINWSADKLQAIVQPWNFGHLILMSEEPVLAVSPKAGNETTVIEPDLLEASFRTDTGGTLYLSFVLDQFSATRSGISKSDLRAEGATLHFRLYPTVPLADQRAELIEPRLADMSLSISNLKADLSDAAGTSSILLDISLRGQFTPRLTPYSLAAWRDAGGTVEVEALSVAADGPLFDGTGSLSLDEKLRPLGALSVTTNNMPGTLSWFRDVGLLSAGDHTKVESAVLSLSRFLGSDPPLMLPVTLQDGFANIGPVAIARVKPILEE